MRDNLRKLLTSYRYNNCYPPSDLAIQSSFEQPYLSFDSSTNRFSHSATAGDKLSSPAKSCTDDTKPPPRIIIYMIPGNPGLVEFYEKFISLLCTSLDRMVGGCEVVCGSHLGHSLRHNHNTDFRFLENFKIWNNWSPSISTSNLQQSDSLVDQVEYHSQIVGKIINEGIHRPDHTKLIIMGHSVGGYIATKILERYPTQITHVIGLFPTISHIARSPNGRRLSPLFSPILLPFINLLQLFVCFILPKTIIYRLITLVYNPISGTRQINSKSATQEEQEHITMKEEEKPDKTTAASISEHNLLIMFNFILNINSVSAVLKMARSEMESIRDLNLQLITRFKQQLTFIWTSSEADEWVGETEITEIIDTLNSDHHQADSISEKEAEQQRVTTTEFTDPATSTSNDPESSTLFRDQPNHSSSMVKHTEQVPSWKRMHEGVPHAFCLKDNEVMAKECSVLIQNKLSHFLDS
ncbi:hypothetical protein PCASD_11922 [Puccinia coronata f. sp. avenae]|uniref:AB hydrolase-1 domain-containing protein n=1 Tax=Puccinia coronata f. sp. avenae TaxID=200324 RepID=A0A2N5U343_9BASI|nr:hypothetical protein PCASD_20324 [Puccinia coronata f. sp. avenae]PLW42082.1 hypothetical protein PCASD_11922 [Puccinia coronata f. sp. avenae]